MDPLLTRPPIAAAPPEATGSPMARAYKSNYEKLFQSADVGLKELLQKSKDDPAFRHRRVDEFVKRVIANAEAEMNKKTLK